MTDMGFDVLREFWPEIARKLRIPFPEEPTDQQSPDFEGNRASLMAQSTQ